MFYIFVSQKELSDLVRNLGLSKSSAELLLSRWNKKNMLCDSARVTYYRNTHQEELRFFSRDRTWLTVQIIISFCTSLECNSTNPKAVHWQQQAIAEICCTQRQPLCLCPALAQLHWRSVKRWSSCWRKFVLISMSSWCVLTRRLFTKYPCFLCVWTIGTELSITRRLTGLYKRN